MTQGCANDVLLSSEMREADRRAVESGVSSLTLMENAGLAIATEVAGMVRTDRRIGVIAGTGNNGGDGFVAARRLRSAGYEVRVFLLGEKSALSNDAAEMARRWTGPTREASPDSLQGMHLIIDALFGTGLSRPPSGDAAELIVAMNASGLPIVAADVPSGVDASTGAVEGVAVRARRTVTFYRKKPCHLLMPSRALCGDVVVADIGIPDTIIGQLSRADGRTFENTPALWLGSYPWRSASDHKYKRGHVVAVSGPRARTGAARLGARAALRMGAGLVTVASPGDAEAENAAHLTAIMLRVVDGADALSVLLADGRINAVLIGPGLAADQAARDGVGVALRSAAAMVIDAGALSAFAGCATDLMGLLRTRSAPVVLTPHDGEFARVFPKFDGCKLARAKAAARQSGAIVVLKGADTVIAAPDGRAAINANAPPWLATAGSGDVLAGMITGLLSQGMSSFEAACAAVWLHGDTAEAIGLGLIAEDIPDALPATLVRLRARASQSRIL